MNRKYEILETIKKSRISNERYIFKIKDISQNINFNVIFSDYNREDINGNGTIKITSQTEIDRITLFYCLCSSYGELLSRIPKEERTYEICKTSVTQNGMALSAVPEQFRTDEIYEIALKENGLALKSIPKEKRTKKLCELAVQSNGLALKYVPAEHITEEMCAIAFASRKDVFSVIPNQHKTKEMCLEAVEYDIKNLEYVPDAFLIEIYREKVINNPKVIISHTFSKEELQSNIPPFSGRKNLNKMFWYKIQKRVLYLEEQEKRSTTIPNIPEMTNEELNNPIRIIKLQVECIEKLDEEEKNLIEQLETIRNMRKKLLKNILEATGGIENDKKR